MAQARKAGVPKDDLEGLKTSTDAKPQNDESSLSDLFISVQDLNTCPHSAQNEEPTLYSSKSFGAYSLSCLVQGLPPQTRGSIRVLDVRLRAGDSDENHRLVEFLRQKVPKSKVGDIFDAALNTVPVQGTVYLDFGTTRQLWSNALSFPSDDLLKTDQHGTLIFRTPIRYQSGTVPGPRFAVLYDTIGVVHQADVGCLGKLIDLRLPHAR